jgi:aryl-alcohol dehydrogenase-like predicted oxidoreductase
MVAGVGRPIIQGQPELILNAVLDSGINYIDVAVDYGEAEEQIGRCISNRRNEFFIASKCGCPQDVSKFSPSERTRFGVPLPRFHDYSRQNIVSACEQSLRRLKTDYLDILQFHFSPAREVLEQEGAIETVLDLKKEGKIRFIGCSSILPNITDHIDMGVFDVLQIPYSALQPEHESAIALAAEMGVGIVIRGGLARGEPGVGHGSEALWGLWNKAGMDELLEDMSATEFMLRFTITNPHVHTTIVGTLNPKHLQTNLSAVLKGPLPDRLYSEAQRRLEAARMA